MIPYKSGELSSNQLEVKIRSLASRLVETTKQLKAICERHEETIRQRWATKRTHKRKDLLRMAWPGMAEEHLPNWQAARRYRSDSVEAQKPEKLPVSKGPEHDWFCMPYMNLEDLSKNENLLLLLNSRARIPLYKFVKQDLRHILVAEEFDWIKPLKIMEHDSDMDPLLTSQFSSDSLVDLGVITGLGADWHQSRKPYGECKSSRHFLTVLDVQFRIMDFLLKMTLAILSDIALKDLIGPEFPVKDEPPAIIVPQEGVMVFLHERISEAPYILEPEFDMARVTAIATSRQTQAEDHLLALRDDPGYFLHRFEEYCGQTFDLEQPIQISVDQENQSALGIGIEMFFCDIVYDVVRWEGLSEPLKALCYECISHDWTKTRSASEPPTSLELELRNLHSRLESWIKQAMLRVLGTIPLSTRIKPLIEGTKMSKSNNFHQAMGLIEFATERRAELLSLVDDPPSEGWFNRAGSLVDEFDQRYTASHTRKFISEMVASYITDLALMWDIGQQIELCLSRFPSFNGNLPPPLGDWNVTGQVITKLQAVKTKSDRILGQSLGMSMVSVFRNVHYPLKEQLSRETVQSMQTAERELAGFWKMAIAKYKVKNAWPKRCAIIVLEPIHKDYQTSNWVELAPTETAAMKQTNSGCQLDDDQDAPKSASNSSASKVFGAPSEQLKLSLPSIKGVINPMKTSQSPEMHHEITQNTSQDPSTQTAIKTLRSILNASTSGARSGDSLPWTDFVLLMCKLGLTFHHIGGSGWHFKFENQKTYTFQPRDGIIFHEPYPYDQTGTMSYMMVRQAGARLRMWGGGLIQDQLDEWLCEDSSKGQEKRLSAQETAESLLSLSGGKINIVSWSEALEEGKMMEGRKTEKKRKQQDTEDVLK